ncbi:MAG TPA: AAA family ATPase [Acidimicrobiia bacterium]
MEELITEAKRWHDAGYCVVPTHEDGGKRPFGAWKSYQAERLSWDDLHALLTSGRYSGIGVLTGAVSGNAEMIEIEGPLQAALKRLSKVTAVARDYDSVGMPELLTRLANGCAEESAGGGLHLFLRVTDAPAHGNTKLAHADGKVIAETRGEGGFVVVAPTTGRNGHPEGAAYRLLNNCTPAKTLEGSGEDRDLLHLLMQMALHEDEPEAVQASPSTPSSPSDGVSAFDDYRARVTWREILEPEGWTFVHSDGTRDHWTRPGKKPSEGTSATTIEDGPLYCFSTSVGWPAEKGLSKGQVYALLHHGGDLSAASRELSGQGYGSGGNHSLPTWEAELDPDASEDEKAEAQASWVREHLPLLDWHELWADETKEEWLVEPILAARRLVALYSAPKVGKSLLMLEIAAGLAAGRSVLGNPVQEPVRVLYVDFENDPRGDIRRRLEDMGYRPEHLDNLCYLTFPTMAALDSEQGSQQLAAAVDEYGCQVVVIDTVSRAIKGEENENDTWLAFYRHTGLKLKQRGVAMIRLDHAGKDESKGQRGGSAKSGDVDAVWRMSKRTEDIYDLICEAKRFPIAEDRLTIRRDEDPLRHVVDSSARKDAAEQVVAWMAAADIPKDGSISMDEIKKELRNHGHSFGNGVVTKATYRAYCERPNAWHPTALEAS